MICNQYLNHLFKFTCRPSIFTVVGESGCGKSAILANWVRTFHKQHPDIKMVAHYVGSSASSTDITSFLKRATYELGGELAGVSVNLVKLISKK